MTPTQDKEHEALCCKMIDPSIKNIADEGRTSAENRHVPCECLHSPIMTPITYCDEPMYQPSPLCLSKQKYIHPYDLGCDYLQEHFSLGDVGAAIDVAASQPTTNHLHSPIMTPITYCYEQMYHPIPLCISKQKYIYPYDLGCDYLQEHFPLGDVGADGDFAASQPTTNHVNTLQPQSIALSSRALPELANLAVPQCDWLRFAGHGMKENHFVPYGQYDSKLHQSGSSLHDAIKSSVHTLSLTQATKYDTEKQFSMEDERKPLKTLSAYNFFFRHERERILAGDNDDIDYSFAKKESLLCDHWFKDRSQKRSHRKSHGKVSFASLSRTVAQRWKELPDDHKQFYRDLAVEDLRRYRHELIQREIGSNIPFTNTLRMRQKVHVQDIIFKASSFFDLTPIPFCD